MSDVFQVGALTMGADVEPSEIEKIPLAGRSTGSSLLNSLVRASSWILEKARKQQVRKTLKVSETVSLGDKRFVAVVQVAHERFLIGGAASSVSMLARLEPGAFAEVLRSREAAQ